MKNYSKKILVVLLALLPCFQTVVMAGGFDDPDPQEIPVKQKPSPNPDPNPGGHRSRGRFIIEETVVCQYYNSEVTIMADSSITYISAQVVRLDDNTTWSNAGAGDTLVIAVSNEPGIYVLTFTLSNGKSYYGEYTLY
ncbi:MAG: hypothetical protein J5705_08340 [Bacteroidaceae bacterium]|nr:hypothetical protein [Bacteroidaceae bacterium]